MDLVSDGLSLLEKQLEVSIPIGGRSWQQALAIAMTIGCANRKRQFVRRLTAIYVPFVGANVLFSIITWGEFPPGKAPMVRQQSLWLG